ncbi:MAG TPA: CoA pyrophosphatase [Dehalococcoidia bacterium]|jgi:8-oxo-dGTP pyrophosphatase MutT (NUDIX family)|nr:CoA pyrophosphatase [Dehalococcoidia bacterium]
MTDLRALSRRLVAAHEPVLVQGDVLRASAVLLLLYEQQGREYVLFQERTQEVQHHKGEVSLPGGRRDPEDGTLEDTALRETDEEIGVVREHIEVFGALDEVATRSSNYVISPFVGAITQPGAYFFRTAQSEVKELLIVPLDHLTDAASAEWRVIEDGEDATAEREFHYDGHRIWGATARIVGQYIDLLAHGEGATA